ncbi:hypothetical protein BDA99DRAFT_559668 [Phascolomyces articulosus]|uniref:Uncharacterized protein n=1 Tax=Phascolomyces articulosus TaxID=60185 RepID=A0AAD5KB77_9FUNG|nr:hypothetical protein BDA99DRAFT_559668 [Phascolomyces articulosus]
MSSDQSSFLTMMHQNPDPFCAYSTPANESAEISTALPPVSLIDYPPQTPLTAFDAHGYGLYASGAQAHHSLTSSQNHHSHYHNHYPSSAKEEEKQQQNSNLSINTTTTTTTTEIYVEETKEKPKIGLPPQQRHDYDRSSSVSSADESTQTTQVCKETFVGGLDTHHRHHPLSPPSSSLPPPPSQHNSITLDST